MAINLLSRSGATFRISNGHWAVLLTLAQAYGWKPAGTKAPVDWPRANAWSGRYDSSDGQTVTDADAKLLAQVLHAAVVGPKFSVALPDMIRFVEGQVEAAGTRIPDSMRMKPEHFSDEYSLLLTYLYQGEFEIN